MRTVDVSLGERSYRIRVGRGLLATLGEHCQQLGAARRCALICDQRLARRYGKVAAESMRDSGFDASIITVPGGEPSKSLKVVQSCYDQLAACRIERQSLIVAVGGGVIGDLAGFVAATYLRGVPFVQVPTTLLAQVDSSVGGKVGVNLKAGKNLVGAFHQPRLVLCDLDVLQTLPRRELRAGLAEVIKYGIIYDAAFFSKVEQQLSALLELKGGIIEDVVARCCQIKAEVVSQDETEGGLRQILNFGHTIGHAIEAISKYGKYLHGEAITIGQVAAARLSHEVLGCSEKDVRRVRELFRNAGLPTGIRLKRARSKRLMAAMQLDKKVSGGEVRFVLMERIGKVRGGQKVPLDLVQKVLR